MEEASSGFFSSDRAVKYGLGVLRLGLLTFIAFQLGYASHDPKAAASIGIIPYFASLRWMTHAFLGSMGAVVNVEIMGFSVNVLLLAIGGALCIWDARLDYSILVYLVKTFGGDFIAGKLDTPEWKLVLFFVFGLFMPTVWLAERAAPANAYAPYARILPLLFLSQAFCELGDAKLEHWTFFRHRYSFEIANALLLVGLAPALTPPELAVVQYDLVVCWFYRLSNFAVIVSKSGAASTVGRKLLFRLFGLLRGVPLVNVTDLDVALAVLKSSDVKGAALERFVASPAWLPALSLESVDGPLYHAMIADFHALLKCLPPPATVHAIAAKHAARLVDAIDAPTEEKKEAAASQEGQRAAEGPAGKARPAVAARSDASSAIDADAVARFTVEVYADYLFGALPAPGSAAALASEAEASVRAELVAAVVAGSWEWRKEIAVRGRGDPGTKARAVRALLQALRGAPALWAVHQEQWSAPEKFSLLLQPFLLSPCINVGDIAVSLEVHPDLTLEDAMRRMHPFPIFERWLTRDVVVPAASLGPASGPSSSGAKAATTLRKGTQVMMFTADFAGCDVAPWPVFGAGPRQCAGTQLALPVLKVLHGTLRPHRLFAPSQGHRFSGRHNDGNATVTETLYFLRTVLPVVFFSPRPDPGGDLSH